MSDYLTGKILLAMPSMADPRFTRSVIYLCSHTPNGAMGIVINHPLEKIKFQELTEGLGIPSSENHWDDQIFFGGPIEVEKGFILHQSNHQRHDSLIVNEDIAITATVEFLKSIAAGEGPDEKIFALGYAGWEAGQLEDELKQNTWLTLDADADYIFDGDYIGKWEKGMLKLGIAPAMLSENFGSA